jgi:hypothetical protein
MVMDYTSPEFAGRIQGDVTEHLDEISTRVMLGRRLPPHDPYLINVCITAIREIQLLRQAVVDGKRVASGWE